MAFFLNFIAMYYHVARAIPFLTMLAVAAICFFIILPLNLVGTILGRNLAGHADAPCRVNAVPRPIPEKKVSLQAEIEAYPEAFRRLSTLILEIDH